MVLFIGAHLFADEEPLLVRQAEAYFEAKEYEKSKGLYEKLMAGKLKEWQKERLLYNIGTIDLEEGKWRDSAEVYSEIAKLPKDSFLLKRALKTNEAILFFRQGSEILEKPAASLDDWRKALFHLRSSLRNIAEAQEAACCLEKFMGGKTCREPEDLKELHTAAKRNLAIAFKKYDEAKVKESSLKEGIPFLLAAIKLALAHLSFLENKNLDANLKESYLKLFIQDAESWLLLWNAQMEKLEKLKQAYSDYQKGIEKMRKGLIDKSRKAFIRGEDSLVKLIRSLWGKDPLIKLLQNLLADYEIAKDLVWIQTSTLYQLEAEQSQIEEIIKEKKDLQKPLAKSHLFLKKSIENAKLEKSAVALFYFNEAMQSLRLLLRSRIETEKTPEQVLEDAIEDQTHAITLQRLALSMEEEKEAIGKLVKSSQEDVFSTIQPFIPLVLQKEEKDYPHKCQCKPWNLVIPLFEKGKQAASEAKRLQLRKKSSFLALSFQEKALNYWKKALEKLRFPEKRKKEPKKKNEKISEEKTSKKKAPKEEKTSLHKVLQLLEQMDRQDRSLVPGETTSKQGGGRPW